MTVNYRNLWRGSPGDFELAEAYEQLSGEEPAMRRAFAEAFGLEPTDPGIEEHPAYRGRRMRRLMAILGPSRRHLVGATGIGLAERLDAALERRRA